MRHLLTLVMIAAMPLPALAEDPYVPAPTVLEELPKARIELPKEYVRQRPRMEFTAADKAALSAKAKEHPGLWKAVVRWADELKGDSVSGDDIRRGVGYHFRPNRIFAAALVGYLSDDEAYKRLAAEWTLKYCKEDTWGTGYQANVDMAATWYSYYLSLAYDILWPDLSQEQRKAIRDGLAAHAKALYDSQVPIAASQPGPDVQKNIRWEQGHMYMPLVGLGAIAFALAGETPDAQQWADLTFAKMRRTFWVHSEDGYHFEGPAYWDYAIHWPLRYGLLLERATGRRLYDIPHYRHAATYVRHIRLPGPPSVFDIADCGGVNNWPGGQVGRRIDVRPAGARYVLRGVARAFRDGSAQALAEEVARANPSNLDPAIEFLWFDPAVRPTDGSREPPYHHFRDHDVVFWRSSWEADATCYAFRCGPPEGHAAAAKLARLTDWTMNNGHTHPDVGAFLMFARGRYLAVDTGYLCEKRAAAHNTLLVDGNGQWQDGSYWSYRGVRYEKLDRIRVEKAHLEDAYGYVCGDLSPAYPDSLAATSMRRHLVMTHDWLLVVDDLSADQEHTYTWLVHTDGPIRITGREAVSPAGEWQKQGDDYVWRPADVALSVRCLTTGELDFRTGPTNTMGGGSPGQGIPQQRGYRLAASTPRPVKAHRFVFLLAPSIKGQPAVEATTAEVGEKVVRVRLKGASQPVELRLDWRPGAASPGAPPVSLPGRGEPPRP